VVSCYYRWHSLSGVCLLSMVGPWSMSEASPKSNASELAPAEQRVARSLPPFSPYHSSRHFFLLRLRQIVFPPFFRRIFLAKMSSRRPSVARCQPPATARRPPHTAYDTILSIAPECCHSSHLKLRFLKARGGSTLEQSVMSTPHAPPTPNQAKPWASMLHGHGPGHGPWTKYRISKAKALENIASSDRRRTLNK